MFQALLPTLLFVLFSFPFLSATRYGASCKDDTGCDQHQKCIDRLCRCNPTERRFWTGEYCAICAREYTLTFDRCYRSFQELKTWKAARDHCRTQYADLFTWRNNNDEIFIKPIVHQWTTLTASSAFWNLFFSSSKLPDKQYLAWAGGTVISTNPHAVQWVDPAGLKLQRTSDQWCDRTKHFGYESYIRQPNEDPQTLSNGTVEHPQCLTYIFGPKQADLLCLAVDYCSQKYPFVCEMNAASMKLATQSNHGSDGNPSGGSGAGDGNQVDFEQPPPPPPSQLNFGNPFEQDPSALTQKKSLFSTTNLLISGIVVALLIVGAVAGYVVMQKRKNAGPAGGGGHGGATQGRPSFASSIGSAMDE